MFRFYHVFVLITLLLLLPLLTGCNDNPTSPDPADPEPGLVEGPFTETYNDPFEDRPVGLLLDGGGYLTWTNLVDNQCQLVWGGDDGVPTDDLTLSSVIDGAVPQSDGSVIVSIAPKPDPRLVRLERDGEERWTVDTAGRIGPVGDGGVLQWLVLYNDGNLDVTRFTWYGSDGAVLNQWDADAGYSMHRPISVDGFVAGIGARYSTMSGMPGISPSSLFVIDPAATTISTTYLVFDAHGGSMSHASSVSPNTWFVAARQHGFTDDTVALVARLDGSQAVEELVETEVGTDIRVEALRAASSGGVWLLCGEGYGDGSDSIGCARFILTRYDSELAVQFQVTLPGELPNHGLRALDMRENPGGGLSVLAERQSANSSQIVLMHVSRTGRVVSGS